LFFFQWNADQLKPAPYKMRQEKSEGLQHPSRCQTIRCDRYGFLCHKDQRENIWKRPLWTGLVHRVLILLIAMQWGWYVSWYPGLRRRKAPELDQRGYVESCALASAMPAIIIIIIIILIRNQNHNLI